MVEEIIDLGTLRPIVCAVCGSSIAVETKKEDGKWYRRYAIHSRAECESSIQQKQDYVARRAAFLKAYKEHGLEVDGQCCSPDCVVRATTVDITRFD
jgi:hypothetical protein